MGPQVAAMVQQAGTKKRRLGTIHRRMGTNGHRFESTAEAIALPSRPKPWEPKPLIEAPAPMSEAPLSPGEKRQSKTYRQRSMVDVIQPLAWTVISGALVGLASIPICAAAHVKWYWPLTIWIGATTIAWFVSSKDLLDDDKLVASVQEMVRAPEPKPIVTQPQPVTLEIIDREGKTIDRPTLYHPAANVQGLAEYADALLRGTAMPSMDGGKETNGARSYGYTESEFERWRNEAVRARLLVSKGKGQGYEITPRGRRSFGQIARLELESASYGS